VPRFLCDEMLRGLGRWLLRPVAKQIVAVAGIPIANSPRQTGLSPGNEGPVSCRNRRGTAPAVLVPGYGMTTRESCTLLSTSTGSTSPFIRCIVGKSAARDTSALFGDAGSPERSPTAGGPLRVCPECGPPLWPGGHICQVQQRFGACNARRPDPVKTESFWWLRRVSVAAVQEN
jgi:uncharacterized protein with PIN domain